jgi:hypothetical protein
MLPGELPKASEAPLRGDDAMARSFQPKRTNTASATTMIALQLTGI